MLRCVLCILLSHLKKNCDISKHTQRQDLQNLIIYVSNMGFLYEPMAKHKLQVRQHAASSRICTADVMVVLEIEMRQSRVCHRNYLLL